TLRSMSVSERDLLWTEWVRKNHQRIQQDLQHLERRWQHDTAKRTSSDRLRAKWITWLLTTTALNLRDRATRALYWFGRGDPTVLFEQAINTSSIDDPYVFERVLAASYGVAMAKHCDPRDGKTFCQSILPKYAQQIFDLMFHENARGRTTHILTREYGRRFIDLASRHKPKLFSKKQLTLCRPPYSIGKRISWPEVKTDKQELHGLG